MELVDSGGIGVHGWVATGEIREGGECKKARKGLFASERLPEAAGGREAWALMECSKMLPLGFRLGWHGHIGREGGRGREMAGG